jgi:phosphoribosylformylglycinamidine synthase
VSPVQVTSIPNCEIDVNGQQAVSGSTAALRDVWEETSFALERLQSAEECVEAEQQGLKHRKAPSWHVPFTPTFTPAEKMNAADKVSTCMQQLVRGLGRVHSSACW